MTCQSGGKLWVLVLVIVICLAPSRTLAQGEAGRAAPAASRKSKGRAAQEEISGPPTTGPILTSGALPMGQGNFAIQPYTYVSFLPAQVSGTRNWGFTGGFNLHKYARPFILYLNLWYFMATIDKRETVVDGGVALEKFNPWDLVKFNLAAEIPLRWQGGPWVVLLEMNSFWEAGPIFGPGPDTKASAEMTGLVGMEYIFNPQWRLAFGFAFDIFGKNSTIHYTPVITLYKPLSLFQPRGR